MRATTALKNILAALYIPLLILPVIACCQTKTLACSNLKNGIFYSYPKNTSDRYISVREGEIQTEVNLKNGDTTVWQVSWLNDCSYVVKYVSGAKTASKDVIDVLKKHKLVYEMGKVTDDYYVFTGHFDKTSNTAFQNDTMWLHEKAVVANNELFKLVTNQNVLRKEHFSDTSKYALLCLYRPGKVTNSLSSFLVYFDDNLMYVAKNNSGAIFKVLKEGIFTLKSRLYKDESSLKLSVEFGNRYYVKSMIHWGIYSRLYNFKLEMASVPPEVGKVEFESVDFGK